MTQSYQLSCPDCGHTEAVVSGEHPRNLERPCPACDGRLTVDG